MNYKIILLLIPVFNISAIISGQKPETNIIVTGEVRDSLQRPVKSANIFIDNVETSASTDRNGYFKISVKPDAEEILVLSALHGASKTRISGRRSINFTLLLSTKVEKDSLIYSEKSRKSNLRDSKASKNKDNSGVGSPSDHRFSTYRDIFEMIQGELPNVLVRGTSVYAEGLSTFGGSSEAIFVVDGIMVDQINDVLPNDVMSIKLLKGPETASYGMRGANGVIIITTRRGTDKK